MGSQRVGQDWATKTAKTSLLTKGHFTSQRATRANPQLYLSAFIRRLGGSSRSWLCCTSKTSTEVLSSLSGSLVSWLCPASSFRRLLLQNRLCEQGQREKVTYWELVWDEGLKMNGRKRSLKITLPRNLNSPEQLQIHFNISSKFELLFQCFPYFKKKKKRGWEKLWKGLFNRAALLSVKKTRVSWTTWKVAASLRQTLGATARPPAPRQGLRPGLPGTQGALLHKRLWRNTAEQFSPTGSTFNEGSCVQINFYQCPLRKCYIFLSCISQ